MTQPDLPTKSVHIVLGSTPRQGRTTVARLIAECLIRRDGSRPMCIDTAPCDEGLAGIVSLPVQELPLIDFVDRGFDLARLDELVDMIVEGDRTTVIDTEISAFRSLLDHLAHFHMIDALSDAGFEVCLHSVLAGDDAIISTISDLGDLLDHVGSNARHIVWLNALSEAAEFDGRRFEEGLFFTSHARDISSVVRLGRMDDMPYGGDFAALLSAKLTFAEALTPRCDLPILQKLRLKELAEVMFLNVEQGIAFDAPRFR